jgi:inosine/xanthosine triphosphatase
MLRCCLFSHKGSIDSGEFIADYECMKIYVGSQNPTKIDATRAVFKEVFPENNIDISGIAVESRVPDQPLNDDVLKGAIERAKGSLRDADYAVGIEAGLITNVMLNTQLDVQYCVIIDQSGQMSFGHGPGFYYPQIILDEVSSGKSVGEAMTTFTGIKDIGKTIGAIGYLSKGSLSRTELTRQAVLMAMIPRIRSELYV